jgi:hypothetical protein
LSSAKSVWDQRDPLGRVVTLSEDTWTDHISSEHPEVDDRESVRVAIEDPDYVIREQRKSSASSIYYREGGCTTFPKLKLAVVAQWESHKDGRVVTAYATKSPKSQGSLSG